jgi:hypothetical protein
MKRTDILRKERELKRSQKKEERISGKGDRKDETSVGGFIDRLHSLFFHDDVRIYNALQSEEILGVLEEAKQIYDMQQVETIVRKAVRKAKVEQKDQAFDELMSLIRS